GHGQGAGTEPAAGKDPPAGGPAARHHPGAARPVAGDAGSASGNPGPGRARRLAAPRALTGPRPYPGIPVQHSRSQKEKEPSPIWDPATDSAGFSAAPRRTPQPASH